MTAALAASWTASLLPWIPLVNSAADSKAGFPLESWVWTSFVWKVWSFFTLEKSPWHNFCQKCQERGMVSKNLSYRTVWRALWWDLALHSAEGSWCSSYFGVRKRWPVLSLHLAVASVEERGWRNCQTRAGIKYQPVALREGKYGNPPGCWTKAGLIFLGWKGPGALVVESHLGWDLTLSI